MRVVWTVPAALWGLLLLAVPVVVHLLQQPRLPRIPLPSLRFVPRAPLAAARRRVLHDLPLLLVRVATVTAAVLALAGPVVVTPGRAGRWDARVTRAVVVDRSASAANADVAARADAAAQREAASAFRAQVFPAEAIEAAVPAALRWLEAQPPAAREVVVVSDGQAGTFGRWPVGALPGGIGVRVTTVAPAAAAPAIVRLGAAADGRHAAEHVPLRLELSAGGAVTHQEAATAAALPAVPVSVRAPGPAQGLVEAVWAGVLDEGLRVRPSEGWVAVEVAWQAGGAVERAGGPTGEAPAAVRRAAWAIAQAIGRAPGVAIDASSTGVRVRIARAPDPAADAPLLRAVRDAAAGEAEVGELEPRQAEPADWQTIERPLGPSPGDAVRRVEATDARWGWAVVLLLLAIESWWRRRARGSAGTTSEVARAA